MLDGNNAKLEKLTTQRQDMEAENTELQAGIEEMQARQEAELPRVNELNAACETLKEQIEVKNTRQSQQRTEFYRLREESKALKDELINTQALLLDAADGTRKLESQIVQSPARIKGELKRMEQNLLSHKGTKRRGRGGGGEVGKRREKNRNTMHARPPVV